MDVSSLKSYYNNYIVLPTVVLSPTLNMSTYFIYKVYYTVDQFVLFFFIIL